MNLLTKLFKKVTQRNKVGVTGLYISQERSTARRTEPVYELFQFRAGENFGSIFELNSNYPLNAIKKDLDDKIKEIESKRESNKDNEKALLMIDAAIKNIKELCIYTITTEDNKLVRKYICNYKELGA